MERFLDKVQLFTIDTIDHANSESELLDIYTYLCNHRMLSSTIVMTFLKNPATPEKVIQELINTPTPILEQIAEMEISEEVKKQLLNNPGTPYSVKETLDGDTYQHSGFCL